jgi:hyperosmotically inducible protein
MKPMSKTLSAVFLAATMLSVTGCSSPPPDTTQYLSDVDVTNKAKVAIYSDPLTKDSQIIVSTTKGVVQLTGSVSSQAAKEKAGDLARGVSGAFGVKNDLQIINPSPSQIIIKGDPQIIIKEEPQPK